MSNIPISKSSMADWISDFVNSLNKNNKEETNVNVENDVKLDDSLINNELVNNQLVNNELVNNDIDEEFLKSAEININDLPKVVWNDETFYVLFDNESGKATILNEFTNIVTTIDASTIEEVDVVLNSKQIVSNKEENLSNEFKDSMLKEIESLKNQIDLLQKNIDELQKRNIIEVERNQIDKVEENVDEVDEINIDEIDKIKEIELEEIENLIEEIDKVDVVDVERINEIIEELNEEDEELTYCLLNEEDTDTFKKAICPICGSELLKANKVGNCQGVVCSGKCKSEYAINLDTEQIYKHK